MSDRVRICMCVCVCVFVCVCVCCVSVFVQGRNGRQNRHASSPRSDYDRGTSRQSRSPGRSLSRSPVREQEVSRRSSSRSPVREQEGSVPKLKHPIVFPTKSLVGVHASGVRSLSPVSRSDGQGQVRIEKLSEEANMAEVRANAFVNQEDQERIEFQALELRKRELEVEVLKRRVEHAQESLRQQKLEDELAELVKQVGIAEAQQRVKVNEAARLNSVEDAIQVQSERALAELMLKLSEKDVSVESSPVAEKVLSGSVPTLRGVGSAKGEEAAPQQMKSSRATTPIQEMLTWEGPALDSVSPSDGRVWSRCLEVISDNCFQSQSSQQVQSDEKTRKKEELSAKHLQSQSSQQVQRVERSTQQEERQEELSETESEILQTSRKWNSKVVDSFKISKARSLNAKFAEPKQEVEVEDERNSFVNVAPVLVTIQESLTQKSVKTTKHKKLQSEYVDAEDGKRKEQEQAEQKLKEEEKLRKSIKMLEIKAQLEAQTLLLQTQMQEKRRMEARREMKRTNGLSAATGVGSFQLLSSRSTAALSPIELLPMSPRSNGGGYLSPRSAVISPRAANVLLPRASGEFSRSFLAEGRSQWKGEKEAPSQKSSLNLFVPNASVVPSSTNLPKSTKGSPKDAISETKMAPSRERPDVYASKEKGYTSKEKSAVPSSTNLSKSVRGSPKDATSASRMVPSREIPDMYISKERIDRSKQDTEKKTASAYYSYPTEMPELGQESLTDPKMIDRANLLQYIGLASWSAKSDKRPLATTSTQPASLPGLSYSQAHTAPAPTPHRRASIKPEKGDSLEPAKGEAITSPARSPRASKSRFTGNEEISYGAPVPRRYASPVRQRHHNGLPSKENSPLASPRHSRENREGSKERPHKSVRQPQRKLSSDNDTEFQLQKVKEELQRLQTLVSPPGAVAGPAVAGPTDMHQELVEKLQLVNTANDGALESQKSKVSSDFSALVPQKVPLEAQTQPQVEQSALRSGRVRVNSW